MIDIAIVVTITPLRVNSARESARNFSCVPSFTRCAHPVKHPSSSSPMGDGAAVRSGSLSKVSGIAD